MYDDPKGGTKVWFKDAPVLTVSEERMCCMKGEITVLAPPSLVFDIVMNLKNRLEWDSMYNEGTIVQQIDTNTRILHLFAMSNNVKGNANITNNLLSESQRILWSGGETHQHTGNGVKKMLLRRKQGIDFCILQVYIYLNIYSYVSCNSPQLLCYHSLDSLHPFFLLLSTFYYYSYSYY